MSTTCNVGVRAPLGFSPRAGRISSAHHERTATGLHRATSRLVVVWLLVPYTGP